MAYIHSIEVSLGVNGIDHDGEQSSEVCNKVDWREDVVVDTFVYAVEENFEVLDD